MAATTMKRMVLAMVKRLLVGVARTQEDRLR
jgi:hypothetical protein